MARTKQVARKSTGGKNPRGRLDLQQRAARRPGGFRIQAVRYAARATNPFDVRRVGFGPEDCFAISLPWHANVLGFIAALRGQNNTEFIDVYWLYGLTNEDLTGSNISRRDRDSPVSLEWLTVYTRRNSDAIWLATGGRYSGDRCDVNGLTCTFTNAEGENCSFADFAPQGSPARICTGPEHEVAKKLLETYQDLCESIESDERFGSDALSKQVRLELGARTGGDQPLPAHLLLEPGILVPFRRKRYKLSCVGLSVANLIASNDMLLARSFVNLALSTPELQNIGRLRDLNALMEKHCAILSDWPSYRLERVLPVDAQNLQSSSARRMEWVLGQNGAEPLLVALEDNEGAVQHVIAITRDIYDRPVVIDGEEREFLPLSKQALDRCCGINLTARGLGEVYGFQGYPSTKPSVSDSDIVAADAVQKKKRKRGFRRSGPVARARLSRSDSSGNSNEMGASDQGARVSEAAPSDRISSEKVQSAIDHVEEVLWQACPLQ